MSNDNKYLGQNNFSSYDGGKTAKIKSLIKIAIIIAGIGVVFYIIYFSVQYGKADFIVSNKEIASYNDNSVESFKQDDKIYFYISKRSKNIDSELFVIEIEYYDNNEYRYYKRISYELGKDFPKLSSYIPSDYFYRTGKYRIKATLDGKVVSNRDIEVSK